MKYFLALIFLLALVRPSHQKNVQVSLFAKWTQTSLLAEASEYFATRDNVDFWDYVNTSAVIIAENKKDVPVTQYSLYHHALQAAAPVLGSSGEDKVLELALATRLFSPRVQMHLSTIPTSSESVTTDAFVLLSSGVIVTDVADPQLNDPTKYGAAENGLPIYEEDHIFPASSTSAPRVAILFGQLGSSHTAALHQRLASLALAHGSAFKYVFRHFLNPKYKSTGSEWSSRIQLQGYGASLHLKNTEYKAVNEDAKTAEAAAEAEADPHEKSDTVAGLDFSILKKRKPNLVSKLTKLEEELRVKNPSDTEDNTEVDLNLWDVQNLGMQACVRIVRSSDPLQELRDLAQNLPRRVGHLSKTNIKNKNSKRVLSAVTVSQQQTIPYEEGKSYLILNGRSVDADDLTIFGVTESIMSETTLKSVLENILKYSVTKNKEITKRHVRTVVDSAFGSKGQSTSRINFDIKYVTWLNNLEKDVHYRRWSKNAAELIMNNQPRMVARNVVNLVSIIDAASRDSLMTLMDHFRMYNQMFPVRLGAVLLDSSLFGSTGAGKKAPVSQSPDFISVDIDGQTDSTSGIPDVIPATLNVSTMICAAFDFISRTSVDDPTAGYSFLMRLLQSTDGEFAEVHIRGAIADWTSETLESILASPNWRKQLNKVTAYVQEIGLVSGFPISMVNGRVVGNEGIYRGFYGERFEIRKYVAQGLVDIDSKDFYHDVLKASKADARYQPIIYESEMFENFQLDRHKNYLREAVWFTASKPQGSIRHSHIVRVDVTTLNGIDALLEAAIHIDEHPTASARVSFVISSPRQAYETKVIAAAISLQNIKTLLKVGFALRERIQKQSGKDIAMDTDLKAAFGRSAVIDGILDVCALFTEGSTIADPVLFSNGRQIVLNSIPALPFISKDYVLLEAHEAAQRTDKLYENLRAIEVVDSDRFSDALFMISSVLGKDIVNKGERRFQLPPITEDDLHGFLLKSRDVLPNNAVDINVIAIIDPLCATSMKMTEIISLLNTAFDLPVSVYLNPKTTLAQVPTKAFYNYVVQSTIAWHSNETLDGPVAFFSRMPSQTLLTMAVEEPEAWLVFATQAEYDLDNVRLGTIPGSTLIAEYELQSILLTGACIDQTTRSPPRGLPLVASLASDAGVTKDTLVMSNYGYFQIQANPGVWNMKIKEGRASDVYTILDILLVDNTNAYYWQVSKPKSVAHVVVNSFTGHHVHMKVAKRPGKENENILVDKASDKGDKPASMWSKIFGGNGEANSDAKKLIENTTVNVFSVASGHLYERFLRLMMFTVTQTTKAKVKFWFIENFLSPKFKKMLPHYAKKFNCEYALVTYKWPHWLRRQTEKQRTIWGYKVLFLDVLFPLDVDRIVYVDADQIVRSDILELYTMDIKDHAVAYTPFCMKNIRDDTKGFRFWAQGYWNDHLRGRPYHISAIYLVDLKTFRRDAAGDSYRATYDNLSQDPNSLANLDQDLPNYLQHSVPIFSLPEEWLWCETWCNDESKVKAKTIDLCNNPKTKTPKLDNARRIIPEWTEWDNALTEFENLSK
eukprot:PhF_6_TR10536/c1_g1_i1/m.16639/K11718/HUGT; UDP-glucose:glycoprotein glucosyltransferase